MSGIPETSLPPERCPDDERLSELLEGDVDVVEQLALERHLDGCSACRQVIAELRALRESLTGLGSPTPSADLFAKVAGAVARRRRRSMWVGTGVVGGLSAAALAVGLVLASRVTIPVEAPLARPPSLRASAEVEFRLAERHYQNALRMLEVLVEEQKTRWPWSRRAAHEADVRILGHAVEETRRLVSQAPEDSALQELLFSSYRAQLDYLREVLSPRTDDAI